MECCSHKILKQTDVNAEVDLRQLKCLGWRVIGQWRGGSLRTEKGFGREGYHCGWRFHNGTMTEGDQGSWRREVMC